MHNLAEFFGPNSPLKVALPSFQPREGQAWMAEAVADTLDKMGHLVVEAGAGTGKTFAYLLPALQSGRKTIISTGTKALQDQLYHRDLPLIAKVVGRPVTTALLKGRANYLCIQRLNTVTEYSAPDSLTGDLNAVREWRHRTISGDCAELTEVEEYSPVWPLVTSTADNCLGSQCPLYQECYVVKARRAAQDADLVVINHHLLLADLALKEDGFATFLPGAEAIILDEAHQIPDLAAQFFGVSLGSREVEHFFNELRGATLSLSQPELQRRLDKAHTALRVLCAKAPKQQGRHELEAVLPQLSVLGNDLRAALIDLQIAVIELRETSIEINKLYDRLGEIIEKLAHLVSDDTWDGLRWLEVNPRSIRFNLTPLDVATTLNGLINANHQAWIFTSATLAVGDDFNHFINRIGLENVSGLIFPSPYALEDHGLIYLPPGLPEPSHPEHTASMLVSIMPLLDMTAGGMFCLFTSHRALNTAKKWFKSRRKKLAGRTLLIQGDSPRDNLLRKFRQQGNAVLLGTGSFWEGVDVRGKALTIVAIDKLPFVSPVDPLMMARLEYIRRQGGNGFSEHQLPQALLALKQGVGRLLRDQSDFGIVVLCDPRIKTKNYGNTFLHCLAPMTSTDSLSEVEQFLVVHETRVEAMIG